MILLVEDDPDDLTLTLRALNRTSVAPEIAHVSDGIAALQFLRAEGPYVDRAGSEAPSVVLLDLNLPKMSGLEVLRSIRRDPGLHRLPVVVLTSSKRHSDLMAGYDSGANSYVRKPVDYLEFLEVIDSLRTYWLRVNESPPT